MGIAERNYRRANAGEGINRNPFAIRPEEQRAPEGVKRAIQPRGDDRERIAYVDHRGLLQSITVDEASDDLTVVSRRKARGTKQQKMAVRSDVNGRERNLAGTKKSHGFPGAYGMNADLQHSGGAEKIAQHESDKAFAIWARIIGRRPTSRELGDLRRAYKRSPEFAETIADKFRR